MDPLKKKSGAAYRKAAKLKAAKQNAIVKKCKNIQDMFKFESNKVTNISKNISFY